MSRIYKYLLLTGILLLPVLLSACGSLLQPVRTSGEAPTPVVIYSGSATDDPNVYVDLVPFRAALLQAIQSRDEDLLRRLMGVNFTSGTWRGEMVERSQSDALRELYQEQLGEEIRLSEAPGVDLSQLMGGTNPLDILPPDANVIDAVFVTGWGKEGRDEAILYVSRQSDNSLRWSGTLVVEGGFSSPETQGVKQLVNTRHGYQVNLPEGYEVQQPNPTEIAILAPEGTQGHRERAFITVEPAGGRTIDQIIDELKTTDLADVSMQPGITINLDTEKAVIFDRVPSQDLMRVLFVVHEDQLYRMYFIPQDETQGEAYNQMKNLYAVMINSFEFIPIEQAGPLDSNGGKLVAEPVVFTNLLQQSLAQRDKAALQSMMGETFSMAYWRSEGLQISPGEAVQQILNNYVPDGAQPVLSLDHPVIATLFPEPIQTDAGETLIPVHVSDWGLEGKDEAIFFIARRADGSLYLQGMLTALGGFGQ